MSPRTLRGSGSNLKVHSCPAITHSLGYHLSSESSMINGKRIAVVLPAYNAEKTLEATVRELPEICRHLHPGRRPQQRSHRRGRAQLGLKCFVHDRNYGYGRNQQTCYREALAAGADVVIMVHPDYQYTPAARHRDGEHDRLWRLRRGPRLPHHRRHSAPRRHALLQICRQPRPYRFRKYVSRREALRISHRIPRLQPGGPDRLPLGENSDDFVFDNQMLAQCVHFDFRIGEVSCPTKYFEEASISTSAEA